MSDPTESLDTQGLLCPLPVIRTQDKIKKMNPGATLEVHASDPGTLHDIPAWVRVHGHSMLDQRQEDHRYTFLIRVVESSS
jgi:tRNA 2-thiouridine synthesizing protein A